jgi:hypothetical protein
MDGITPALISPHSGMISQELGGKRELDARVFDPRRRKVILMPTTRCAAVLLAMALAGCSTVMDTVGDPFVQPGKYDFLRCQEIAQQMAGMEARSKELHELMDKANAGFGGSAVSMFVYAPDLREVDAALNLLHKTSGEKRCDDGKEVGTAAPSPPAAPSTPAAPAATPAAAAVSRGDLGPLH